MKTFQEQNYYELLDIPSNADQELIVEAYKKARTTYNPNSPALYTIFSKTEAEELIKLIDEAYNVLSNQYKRREYDKKFLSTAPVVKNDSFTANASLLSEESSTTIKPVVEKPAAPNYSDDTTFTGSLLQQVRLSKGLTLDQISEVTKISRTYLTAIEAQDYGKLPVTVFLRGFLTQYAKVLGLDAVKVANSYLKIKQEQK